MRETLPSAGCPAPLPLQLPGREPGGSKNEVRPGNRRARQGSEARGGGGSPVGNLSLQD